MKLFTVHIEKLRRASASALTSSATCTRGLKTTITVNVMSPYINAKNAYDEANESFTETQRASMRQFRKQAKIWEEATNAK